VAGLDLFTPETSATFPFTLYSILSSTSKMIETTEITYPNGTLVKITTTTILPTNTTTVPVGDGFVTLKSRGGLSAGNPISMSITFYTRNNTLAGQLYNITVTPQGAYAAQVPKLGPFQIPFAPIVLFKDQRGFPAAVCINLTRQENHKWSGGGTVMYNQGGTLGLDVAVNGVITHVADLVQIGSEATTVAARTNSLLTSLTWVIVGFSALEMRLKDNGCESKKE
jgi:hypothetical protein